MSTNDARLSDDSEILNSACSASECGGYGMALWNNITIYEQLIVIINSEC